MWEEDVSLEEKAMTPPSPEMALHKTGSEDRQNGDTSRDGLVSEETPEHSKEDNTINPEVAKRESQTSRDPDLPSEEADTRVDSELRKEESGKSDKVVGEGL